MDTVLLSWCGSTDMRFCDRSLRSVQVLLHSGKLRLSTNPNRKGSEPTIKTTTHSTQHTTVCVTWFLFRFLRKETVSAFPKFSRELGRVSNFNKSTNRHHYRKDHVAIGHLTKYNFFPRVNKDQTINLEIWLQIHTKVSIFETASPKIIKS